MLERPDIHYVHTPDGARVAYQVLGDGPVDVVAVPGFTTHLDLLWDVPGYADLFERLGRFARVALFDKRGTGLSDRGGGHPPLDQQAVDVEAVMDAVGMERAALFGWSEGAAISTLLAATRPDRVERLALYAGTACIAERPGYPEGYAEQLLEPLGAALIRSWGEDDDVAISIISPSHADDPTYRRAILRAFRAASSPHEVATFLRFIGELDYRHVLPAVGVPTLVVHRSGDRFVPASMGRYLARHIPGATFVELPGEDHPPWCGDPAALVDQVEGFVTGHVTSRVPERILATVMFTDIVGSTERVAAVGDSRWREVLIRHDELVARHVADHGGVRIKSTGDGCMARFDLPGRAIRCARGLIADASRLDLEIRAGLHTGEVEVLGEDIGGVAVHVAARVAATAPDGGVLVTNTVKDLVAGAGFVFQDRGEQAFKGLPEPWRVYLVEAS